MAILSQTTRAELLQGPALIVAVKQKMKMKEIYLTIWAFFHGDSFEFRSCLFRSDASANDISRTGVYRKALCQFFYANAFVVCFQNQFLSFIVQHSSHFLCLCYTSFCSKVKVLCCIIENCYNVMVLSISLISFSVFRLLPIYNRQHLRKQPRSMQLPQYAFSLIA